MPTGSSPRRSSQMPTGKRARMREGPLAALFRKTAEEAAQAAGPRAADAPAPRAPDSAQSQQRGLESRHGHHREGEEELAGDPGAAAPSPADSPAGASGQRGPNALAPPPSPQERLRNVFSADIPESLTARPAQDSSPPAPAAAAPPAAEAPVPALAFEPAAPAVPPHVTPPAVEPD